VQAVPTMTNLFKEFLLKIVKIGDGDGDAVCTTGVEAVSFPGEVWLLRHRRHQSSVETTHCSAGL